MSALESRSVQQNMEEEEVLHRRCFPLLLLLLPLLRDVAVFMM
ncbi:unnamed protein product [Taenia asiatica]|uniref:Uncharacterized protein n=1 Tax=Taenia asiatica TaxID=60517 RepID=A0A0R3WG40_TAEAS|nr:unnamed protein product [Taenia asiatica]